MLHWIHVHRHTCKKKVYKSVIRLLSEAMILWLNAPEIHAVFMPGSQLLSQLIWHWQWWKERLYMYTTCTKLEVIRIGITQEHLRKKLSEGTCTCTREYCTCIRMTHLGKWQLKKVDEKSCDIGPFKIYERILIFHLDYCSTQVHSTCRWGI